MFTRKSGKTKTVPMPVTISTALSKGALVAWSSGRLIAATTTTAGSAIAGVLVKAIASTDSDYATTRDVLVEVPVEKDVLWEADVTATLVVADVGLYCDLTSSLVINRGASTYDIVQCRKLISTTKGLFVLNIGTDAIAK
mgnify:CR=1 FL=1